MLARTPAHETALFGKAVSLQLLWKFDEATALYLQLLGKNPQSEECLVNLVTIGMARKDHDSIQKYSEQLLTLRPHSQAALEGLATCAFHSGDFEAAAQLCAKLVEFTPDHFERWFNLGVAEQKRNHLPEATKAYSEAVRIRPDAKQAHVNLGIVKQESGDLKGAREACERALQIAPDQGDVIYNLAGVIEQQGEKEEAERLYVKLLSRNPIGKTRGSAWAICAWRATTIAAAPKPSRPASASARRGPKRSSIWACATGIWEIAMARPRRLKRCSPPIRSPSTRCAAWPLWRWNTRISTRLSTCKPSS